MPRPLTFRQRIHEWFLGLEFLDYVQIVIGSVVLISLALAIWVWAAFYVNVVTGLAAWIGSEWLRER